MANYLLDTHIFIWATCEADKLSKQFIDILTDDNHTIFLSMASIWEI